MKRKECLKLVEEIEQVVVGNFDRFNGIVIVKGIDDLSCFIFDNAYALSCEDYYMVFPEHHESQVFHREEYDVVQYSNREAIEEYKK